LHTSLSAELVAWDWHDVHPRGASDLGCGFLQLRFGASANGDPHTFFGELSRNGHADVHRARLILEPGHHLGREQLQRIFHML
jgi:hypothetical protein